MPVTCRLCGKTFHGRPDSRVSAVDELADHHNDEHPEVLHSILAPVESEEVSGSA